MSVVKMGRLAAVLLQVGSEPELAGSVRQVGLPLPIGLLKRPVKARRAESLLKTPKLPAI